MLAELVKQIKGGLFMIKVINRGANIAESAKQLEAKFDPKELIIEGLLSATGVTVQNASIFEAFGLTINKTSNKSIDEMSALFLTEALYNPVVTIYNLRKMGKTEKLNALVEAYSKFAELANEFGEEVKDENQALIESSVRIFKEAVKLP